MRRYECPTRPAFLFLPRHTSTTIDFRPAGDSGGHSAGPLAVQASRSARAAVDRQMTYRRLRFSKAEAFPSSRVRRSKASNREARQLSSTKYSGPRQARAQIPRSRPLSAHDRERCRLAATIQNDLTELDEGVRTQELFHGGVSTISRNSSKYARRSSSESSIPSHAWKR